MSADIRRLLQRIGSPGSKQGGCGRSPGDPASRKPSDRLPRDPERRRRRISAQVAASSGCLACLGLRSIRYLRATGRAALEQLAGATGFLAVFLPGLVLIAAVIGFVLAAQLKARDPGRFAQLGSGK